MFLPGWTRTIHGGGFPYHSFDPEMRTALLVRGNRERPSAEFATAPVPATAVDGPARFVWAFAHAASPETVRFTLHVNDEPVLVHTNPRTPEEADATFEGEPGASLRFRRTHTDRHGDPMGFAILTVPGLPPGEAARIRITSEDLGSPTWTMVFEHEVTADISVAQHPLVRRAEGPEVRWVHLSITHLGDDGEVAVSHESREVVRAAIRFGRNTVPVPLPAGAEPRPVALAVEMPGEKAEEIAFTLEPVKEWTIYLVQHTHTDIGYTRPQPEILAAHVDFIERALDICDATDDWPDDAKFRWTCETDLAFREFLRTRRTARTPGLWARIRERRIEVTALPFNFSELPDEASLAAMLFRFGGKHPARLAMQNDVNGLAWCLADFLPTVGVDRFVMGQHSHRALACFDRPTAFWWESPSGSRMLGWRGDHYHTGNAWGIHGTDMEAFGDGLFAHLRGLEEKEYPWTRIAIQYGGYLTDNAPPALSGPETIRRWNKTYEWPRLRSATASEFLDWVREEHGDNLPVFRKAWPDWWTDGFGSAALETAAIRRAHCEFTATSALEAIAVGWGRYVGGHHLLVLYLLLAWDEHTLGAAESVSDPLCENSVVQWNLKASYAWEAVRRVAEFRETVLGDLAFELPLREETSVCIVNPLGFRRPGLAEVYADRALLPPDRRFRLLDPDGREVPAQPLGSRPDGTYWLLEVPDVPALGYASLRVEVSDETAGAPAPLGGTTLANEHYEIEVDPETGTVRRFVDRALGRDLVDANAEWGFLSVVHERLGNRHQLEEFRLDDCERSGMTAVRVEPGVFGPVFDSLVVVGTVPGSTDGDGVRIEIRLLKAHKRVQVVFSVRKLAVTDPEALYLAFPFALPGAVVDYEAQGGMVVPGVDQLPGSSSDWHTVQDFIRVRSDDAQIVVVSGDAPLWHLGGLNLGRFQPLAEVERPHLYSWIMNNYWVTNFRASQEGEVRFTYDITSGPAAPTSVAKRFAAGCRIPFVARVRPAARETRGEESRSLLAEPLPGNVHLVAIRNGGEWRALFLHLRETDGREVVLDPARLFAEEFEYASLTDAAGAEVERINEVRFAPYSVRFLKVVYEAFRDPTD